nr:MAG TPA: hypothetical protein [Caudoviricetes sp.]
MQIISLPLKVCCLRPKVARTAAASSTNCDREERESRPRGDNL